MARAAMRSILKTRIRYLAFNGVLRVYTEFTRIDLGYRFGIVEARLLTTL